LAAKGSANDALLSMLAGQFMCLFAPPFVAKIIQLVSPVPGDAQKHRAIAVTPDAFSHQFMRKNM